jgi:soluble lytic murein transglycosylase-like protein
MKRAISALLILTTYATAPLRAELKSRTSTDGTVEIYSVPGKKKMRENKNFPADFDETIKRIGFEENVDPFLIKCIIKVESDFKPRVISKAGAMGLMQIMMETAHYFGMDDPFDPEQNIRTGTKHFASMLKQTGYDIPLALAAYHAGIYRVKKAKGIPPIQATIDYVNVVMHYYDPANDLDYSEKVKKLYMRYENGTMVISDK